MIFILCVAKEQFPIYGRYCGLNHYDPYGRRGICSLDDACQIHDICTSRGLSDCFCNQQLFWYASNIKPVSNLAASAKRSILRYIYYSIAPCSDFHSYDRYRVLGSTVDRGFNYLPIYVPGLYRIDTVPGTKLYFIWLNEQNYLNFTMSVYADPNSFIHYKPDNWSTTLLVNELAVIYSAEPITNAVLTISRTSLLTYETWISIIGIFLINCSILCGLGIFLWCARS